MFVLEAPIVHSFTAAPPKTDESALGPAGPPVTPTHPLALGARAHAFPAFALPECCEQVHACVCVCVYILRGLPGGGGTDLS